MKRVSFDIVGNIAILNEKTKNKAKAAKDLLKGYKNIKTVLVRKGIHEGRHRLLKYRFLAGERTKETTYKENNVRLFLNIEKTYFSSRLSNERLRISKLTKNGEKVLVMFSGVGPYPIVISKNTKAKEIYGIEINKDAHKYAEENVKLNKTNNIKLFMGNVNKVLPKINKRFDRIIMPLPKSSTRYIRLAIKHLRKKGYLHLYIFSRKENPKRKIKGLKQIRSVRCGGYSPGKDRYCLDFQKV